jgi:hypothetical protein
MNWAEAVVLIVIITSITKIFRSRHKAQIEIGLRAPELAVSSPEADALRREVTDLRERIKVLERIATDGRKARDLADEIDSLR